MPVFAASFFGGVSNTVFATFLFWGAWKNHHPQGLKRRFGFNLEVSDAIRRTFIQSHDREESYENLGIYFWSWLWKAYVAPASPNLTVIAQPTKAIQIAIEDDREAKSHGVCSPVGMLFLKWNLHPPKLTWTPKSPHSWKEIPLPNHRFLGSILVFGSVHSLKHL